jgi:hypothetical protein
MGAGGLALLIVVALALVVVLFAEFERSIIQERIAAGIARAREGHQERQGLWRPGRGRRASAEIPAGAEPPRRRLRKARLLVRDVPEPAGRREEEPNEHYDTWMTNRAFAFKATEVALARTLMA